MFIDIRERNTNSRPYDYSSGTQFGPQSTETAMKKKFLKVKFVNNILHPSGNKKVIELLNILFTDKIGRVKHGGPCSRDTEMKKGIWKVENQLESSNLTVKKGNAANDYFPI